MMRRGAWSLLVLMACSSPPATQLPPPSLVPCPVTVREGGTTDFDALGEQYQLVRETLYFGPAFDCHDQPFRARSVVAEVLAPSNRVVSSQAALIDAGVGEQGLSAATVEFVPTEVGAYTVNVLFEPGLGRVTRTIWVMEVHTDRVELLRTDRACRRYDLSDDGVLWCGNDESLIATVPDGGRHQLASSLRLTYAVANDGTSWLSRDGGAEWRDTAATGFRLKARCPLAAEPFLLAASNDSVLVTDQNGAFAYRAEPDGGCSLINRWYQMPAATEVMPSWNGETAWVPRPDGTTHLLADGGTELLHPMFGVASNADGVWAMRGVLDAVFLRHQGVPIEVRLPLPWVTTSSHFGVTMEAGSEPMILTAKAEKVALSLTGTGHRFERFESPGLQLAQIRPRFAVLWNGTQFVLVRR